MDAVVCIGGSAKQVLSTIAGCMSMGGSGWIMHQFHRRYGLRSLINVGGVQTGQAGAGKQADIAAKLIAWLSVTDFFSSFFFCLGRAPLTDHVAVTRASFMCTLQGWMIQFLGLSTIALTTAIAVNLYMLVVRGKSLAVMAKYEKRYLLACFGPTLLIAMLLLIPNTRLLNDSAPVLGESTRTSYGPAGTWCWVEEKPIQLLSFYLPLACCWLATFYIVWVAVPGELKARTGAGRSNRSLAAAEDSQRMVKTLRTYGQLFFFIWFWGMLNRIIGVIVESECGSPLFFQLMHSFFIPMQGFLNACVYSGLHLRIFKMLGFEIEEDDEATPGAAAGLIVDAKDGPAGSALGRCRTPKQLSLFVGSWNMGEAPAEDDDALSAWIEEGHDLYCVGVQECLTVDSVQAAMARVLAKRSGGKEDEWSSWKHSLGSDHTEVGFHGFIAIIIFVRKSEVASGNFEPTGKASGDAGGQLATGKNVGGKKMANKGAVGCSFRWYDTTLAFAGVHLASDAGDGSSRADRRNEDAWTILRYLKIDSEDVEVDWHLLHHHAFFIGDLNYRIRMEPEAAVEATVAAVKAQNWSALHSADELAAEMKTGRVFSGFEEAAGGAPKFPPTYRRVRDAKPGDYSNVEHVKSCYTLSVPKGAEGETAPRTPSWCDRVLLDSTDGQGGNIVCTSYRLCDELLLSDHVPVTAVYSLTVDADHPAFSTTAGLGDSTVRATLLLSELEMVTTSSESGGGSGVVLCDSYSTIFPLPAEDPDGQAAKLAELGGALALASTKTAVDRVQRISAGDGGEKDKAQLHRIKIALPQAAWLAAKMHMGIKALDATQSSVAQGVLPLADVIVAAAGSLEAGAAEGAIPFDLPMSLGGIHVARLKGVATLMMDEVTAEEAPVAPDMVTMEEGGADGRIESA